MVSPLVSWWGLEARSAQHARLVLPWAQDWAVFYRGLVNKELYFSRQPRAMPWTNHRASYKGPSGKTSIWQHTTNNIRMDNSTNIKNYVYTIVQKENKYHNSLFTELRRNSTQSSSVFTRERRQSAKTSAGILPDGVCQTQLPLSKNTISERVKHNIHTCRGNTVSTRFVTTQLWSQVVVYKW